MEKSKGAFGRNFPRSTTFTIKSFIFFQVVFLWLLTAGQALAVNGVDFIGIGPVSRSMAGVGVAAPQDTLGAIFSNPATMSFAAFSGKNRFDIGATLIQPDNNSATLTQNGANVINAEVGNKIYLAPAIGASSPVDMAGRSWQFGLGVAGVTGLGMDYSGTTFDQPAYFPTGIPAVPFLPLMSGYYTQLGVAKVTPAISTKITDNLAAGLALHVDQITLDVGAGSSSGWAWGFQLGLACKVTDDITTGLTYISKQKTTLNRLADLNGDGAREDLEIAVPQQVAFGASFEILKNKLLVEADVRWINWADAEAWKELDWENEWAYGIGVQYYIFPKLALRAGYNYSKTPVKEHHAFEGAGLLARTNIQGIAVPTYYYETLRFIGIPAFLEHHVTIGLGVQLSKTLEFNIGFVHEFGSSYHEDGTDLAGQNITIDNKMKVNSLDMALSWKF